MLGFSKFLVILGISLTILHSGLAAPTEATGAAEATAAATGAAEATAAATGAAEATAAATEAPAPASSVPVAEDSPKADSVAHQIPGLDNGQDGNRGLFDGIPFLGSLGGLGLGGGKPKKNQPRPNGNGRPNPNKKYTMKETVYENVPSSRVVIGPNRRTKARLVTTRTDPDGSRVTIYRKKVNIDPKNREIEIDYDDTNPSAIIKTVKKKILPDGTETTHVFTSTNTREKIVSTIPASDGSDVTIIRKKVRTAPNGVDYEVDYDEEGPDVSVKTVQRVLKADGTVTFTENFKPSQLSTQTVLTTIRKVVKRLPDGRVVEVDDTENPYTTNTIVQYDSNPKYVVTNQATGNDGSQITIYHVKIRRRDDGSEVEVDPNDDSPDTVTKIVRKVIKQDGTISVTEGYEEPQKSILIARVTRLVKKRRDGSLIEVDADEDTEPKAQIVTTKVLTRRRQVDGTEIDTEDDEKTSTRKIYTTYKNGKTLVTVLIRGEVVQKYQVSPKQRPKFSAKDLTAESKPDLTNEQVGMSSVGSGLRDGLKGVLGVGDLASDAVSGLLGGGAVSEKKNIADHLLDAAVEGAGTIADVPGGIIDGIAKATGTTFLVDPIAYTGGFIGGGIAGGEIMKGKIFYDAGKTVASLLGADALLGYDVKQNKKKEGTSWFLN